MCSRSSEQLAGGEDDRFVAAARQRLASGGSLCFTVSGVSMHPLVRDGDVVTVAPARTGLPVPGQVLLHVHHGRAFMHRLMRVRRSESESDGRHAIELVVRGTAASGPRFVLGPDCVLGVLAGIGRGGRTIRSSGFTWRVYGALLTRLAWLRVLRIRRSCRGGRSRQPDDGQSSLPSVS